MTGTATNTNTKENTFKRKFAGIRTYKRGCWDNNGPKVPPEGWNMFYMNMEHIYPKKNIELKQRTKPRWIFADSFNEKETGQEEVNIVVLV